MTVGELVAFNAYLMMLALADDRVRLGHEPAAARAWRRGSGCSRCSTRSRRSSDAAVRRPRSATLEAIRGDDRVPPPHVRLRRPRRSCTTSRPRIPAGTTTAIVGATGSGKSTLLSLLPRLHDPPPGTVFVDGVDVRDIPLAGAARRHRVRAAGAVPVQRDDRREHRVRRAAAARTAAAARRGGGRGRAARQGPRRLPERLRHDGRRARHHALGRTEAAHGASRARWSIDPRILVLDDALSAVDTYTEEEILRAAARGDARSARRSSSRTASRPCATPIRSSCSTTAASSSAARTTSCCAADGLYAELSGKQQLEEELAAS